MFSTFFLSCCALSGFFQYFEAHLDEEIGQKFVEMAANLNEKTLIIYFIFQSAAARQEEDEDLLSGFGKEDKKMLNAKFKKLTKTKKLKKASKMLQVQFFSCTLFYQLRNFLIFRSNNETKRFSLFLCFY